MKKDVQMFLTEQDRQSHPFNNPPKSAVVGSKEWVREDVQVISMLWNSMEPQVIDLVIHLDSVKKDLGIFKFTVL